MSIDDDSQVVQAHMDRTLREEGESPSSPQQLAAGDFYGNPPVVHRPVYRVDMAIGQDDGEVGDDNDLSSDDSEGDGPFENEEMGYVPSYIQGMLLDESSDLVVRYFEHSVSEVQGLVEDDDEDTYEGVGDEEDREAEDTLESREEEDGNEEDIHQVWQEDESDEEEEDTEEEHRRGSNEYSEKGGVQDNLAEVHLTKEQDVYNRKTVDEDESSESSCADEDKSQQAEEWYSGR